MIIDDLGFQPTLDDAALRLDSRVAVAIIPGAPGTTRMAQAAAAQQRDILIHLPLSHSGTQDCDAPICPRREWSAERMREHLAWASDQVTGAVGLNNHQGSRFTADLGASRRLIEGLVLFNQERQQPLFVVDSRTTPHSQFAHAARSAGLPVGERSVFLDHIRTPEAIEAAWTQLLERARRDGSAIAIGHPYQHTLSFLADALPALDQTEIELVRIGELVEAESRKSTLAQAKRPAARAYRSSTAPSAP